MHLQKKRLGMQNSSVIQIRTQRRPKEEVLIEPGRGKDDGSTTRKLLKPKVLHRFSRYTSMVNKKLDLNIGKLELGFTSKKNKLGHEHHKLVIHVLATLSGKSLNCL